RATARTILFTSTGSNAPLRLRTRMALRTSGSGDATGGTKESPESALSELCADMVFSCDRAQDFEEEGKRKDAQRDPPEASPRGPGNTLSRVSPAGLRACEHFSLC